MPASLPYAGPKYGMPPIWQIHRAPDDRPDCAYVVRVHYGLRPEPDAVPFETLQAARSAIVEAGASYCLGRMAGDAPDLVESWI